MEAHPLRPLEQVPSLGVSRLGLATTMSPLSECPQHRRRRNAKVAGASRSCLEDSRIHPDDANPTVYHSNPFITTSKPPSGATSFKTTKVRNKLPGFSDGAGHTSDGALMLRKLRLGSSLPAHSAAFSRQFL